VHNRIGEAGEVFRAGALALDQNAVGNEVAVGLEGSFTRKWKSGGRLARRARAHHEYDPSASAVRDGVEQVCRERHLRGGSNLEAASIAPSSHAGALAFG